MAIKTTKMTHNQDETFKGDVTFDKNTFFTSFYDMYAKIDGDDYSLGDYLNTYVNISSEQNIEGTKHFKTGDYYLSISMEDDKHGIYADSYGVGIKDGLHVIESKYNLEFWVLHGSGSDRAVYVFDSSKHYVPFEMYAPVNYRDEPKLTLRKPIKSYDYEELIITTAYIQHKSQQYAYPTKGGTLAVASDINATNDITLSVSSGHKYTASIDASAKVEVIVDIDSSYTASFNIAKGMRTAFQMCYGTTSDDVATCFASMDANGLLTIDLDNVQLSSFTPTAKYVIYN